MGSRNGLLLLNIVACHFKFYFLNHFAGCYYWVGLVCVYVQWWNSVAKDDVIRQKWNGSKFISYVLYLCNQRRSATLRPVLKHSEMCPSFFKCKHLGLKFSVWQDVPFSLWLRSVRVLRCCVLENFRLPAQLQHKILHGEIKSLSQHLQYLLRAYRAIVITDFIMVGLLDSTFLILGQGSLILERDCGVCFNQV